MLGFNQADILKLVSMLLPLLSTMKIPQMFKRLLCIASVSVLAILDVSDPVLIGFIVGGSLILTRNSTNTLKIFILVLISISGSWLQPGATELLLVMLGFVVFGNNDNGGIFLIPSFSILFLLYCLNSASLVTSPNMALAFLSVIPLIYIYVLSQKNIVKNGELLITMFIFSWLLRQYVDQFITLLEVQQIYIWSIFNIWSIAYLLLRLLINNSRTDTSCEDFIKTIIIGTYLSSTSGQFSELTSELFYAISMLGLCSILINKMSLNNKWDKAIGLIIGVIVLVIETILILSYELNISYMVIAIFCISSQLFYLIKMIDSKELAIDIYSYRERMPQFVFILVTFGCFASLWYILYYVRQIQG